jgi:ketosteroid isomerase-like protein
MSHLSTFPQALFQGVPRHHDDDPEIEAILVALKAAAMRASETGDVDFYASYLADNAIGVTPSGVFNKQQILQGMKGITIKSSNIEGSRAVALGPDAGLVTYRALFSAAGEAPVEMFVSTLYRRYHDGWKGVFYQQTPLPSR